MTSIPTTPPDPENGTKVQTWMRHQERKTPRLADLRERLVAIAGWGVIYNARVRFAWPRAPGAVTHRSCPTVPRGRSWRVSRQLCPGLDSSIGPVPDRNRLRAHGGRHLDRSLLATRCHRYNLRDDPRIPDRRLPPLRPPLAAQPGTPLRPAGNLIGPPPVPRESFPHTPRTARCSP